MCIRDSDKKVHDNLEMVWQCMNNKIHQAVTDYRTSDANSCLLYTSDAADERSSVDLGGRRIIKNKNR